MYLWPIYRTILIIGALQGIVLGLILWRTKAPRQRANRWLAILLFFLSYRLIAEVLRSAYLLHPQIWTYHVFLEYNWIYGALLFFYIRSYILPDDKWEKRDWLHFLPVAIEFLFSNYVKIQNFYWDGTRESLTWLGTQSYILWVHTPFQHAVSAGLLLYYVFQSRNLLQNYTAADTRPVQKEEVSWVQLLLKCYLYFSLLLLLFCGLDYFFFNYAFNPFYIFPVYIPMALLTYWLGLQGFARKDTPFLEAPKQEKQAPIPENASTLISRLEALMEKEQVYKNSKLSLTDLASQLEIKPYQLTQLLNRSLQLSFSDYVNTYRVREVKRLLNDEDHQHLTLLAIALEAGFNSKASFNRIVKKITGKSPKHLKDIGDEIISGLGN